MTRTSTKPRRVLLPALLASLLPATAFGEVVLTLDDNHEYARYGQTLHAVVTLTNTGGTAATGIAVAAALSPAWDAGGADWVCFPGTSDVVCGAGGTGALADTVTLPPGARATWLLDLPVRGDAQETTATVTVSATGATPLADTNTLVLFKDGCDVAYGDGTQERPGDVDEAPAPSEPGS